MKTSILKKLLGTWALMGCGIAMFSTARADTLYWNTSSSTWSTLANWTTDAAGSNPATMISGTATDVYFNTTAVNGAETITLTGTNAANSLNFNNTGATTLSGGVLQLGAGGMTINSTAGSVVLTNLTIDLMASQTWTFNTSSNTTPLGSSGLVYKVDDSVITPITLTLNGGSKQTSYSGNMTDGANAKLSLVYSGGISLQMKSAQSYSGGTTLQYGYYRLDNATAMAGAFGINQNVVVDTTTNTGTISIVTGATGTVSYNFTVGAGQGAGLNLTNINAASNTTWNANIALNNTLFITGSAMNIYNGIISGTGSVVMNAANLFLNGANTFSGAANIQGGMVSVSSMQAFGTSGTLNFGTGGNNKTFQTLIYTGAGETSNDVLNLNMGGTGGLTLDASGSGALVLASNFANTNNNAKSLTLQGANTDKNTIGGIINLSNLSVVKSGSGTWMLSGSNTYGATTVNAGTLLINGDSSKIGAVTVVANAGAKFGGSGIIGGLVTLNTGNTLIPGGDTTIGTLTLKNGLVLGDVTNLGFDLSGALGDKIVISGGSFLSNGISTIDLNILSSLTAGTYTLLDWSSVTGSTVSLSNFVLDAGSSSIGSLSLSGNTLVLNVNAVPEPSTWVLLTVGGAVLGWTLLRRTAKI